MVYIKGKVRLCYISIHLGQRNFSLMKIQPWKSGIKVTFDIPKAAADLLCTLAADGNVHLNELGILSIF